MEIETACNCESLGAVLGTYLCKSNSNDLSAKFSFQQIIMLEEIDRQILNRTERMITKQSTIT